jgi:outer membrane protein assembly factor BamA
METKPGQILNLNTIRADFFRVRQLYALKGYHAMTEPGETSIRNGLLDIAITVGKVGTVKINGLPISLSQETRKLLRLQPGQFFHLPTFQEDLSRIARMLSRKSYRLEIPSDLSDSLALQKWDSEGLQISWRNHGALDYTLKVSKSPRRPGGKRFDFEKLDPWLPR